MTRLALTAILLLFLTTVNCPQTLALPYFSLSVTENRDLDQDTYLDINKNLVIVDNEGYVGLDGSGLFGRTSGWYYPFSGDINDILSGTENRTVVYSSGLCIGGTVGGQVRVAVTEYESEFVPGPMSGGTFVPDDPRFRVYKLNQSSGPGDQDWDAWPSDLGAPLDKFGFPQQRGNQSLWTVFNDADPLEHDNSSGDTSPLGVEIQVSAWAYSSIQGEDVIFVRYKLFNKGANSISNFYFSFWADPDLGGPTDDLIGCTPESDLFYCYNGDNLDEIYGAQPPAWGGKIISGFLVPSPGDTGTFDGHVVPDHRNLGMTAFNKYTNGTDPETGLEFYNSMQGLNRNGSPMIDPTTGLPTRFAVSGDPVASIGWLDGTPGDRRLLANTGPITFNPGDSQQVELKFAVRIGTNRLTSITQLAGLLNNMTPLPQPPATYIQADALYAYQLNALEPVFPTCYLGQFADGYSANEVNLGSLQFDGLSVIEPEVVDFHTGYGGPVVRLQFSLNDYLMPLSPLIGNQLRSYSVTGQYMDGQNFDIDGQVVIVGKAPGDVNGDGLITVSDAVSVINYIFASGPAPSPLAIADVDCSASVTISDAIGIIKYIFAAGPAPCTE